MSLLCFALVAEPGQPHTTAPTDKRDATGSPASAATNHLARKSGIVLQLSLLNGRVLELTDVNLNSSESNADQVVKYELAMYFESVDYFLVHASYYEGSSFLMISRRSGEKYTLDAEPVFSPGKNRFVTVSLCDAYCTQGIKIYQRTKEGIREEVWLHPTEFSAGERWEMADPRWIDETTLEITSRNVSKDGKQIEGKTYTLRLIEGGWKIARSH
jgi:hypothetical protein